MITPQELDIDRLHQSTELICSGNYRYRQGGKTTAYLHLMLGEWELGDAGNTYLYLAHTQDFAEEVCREFKLLAFDSPAYATNAFTYFNRFRLVSIHDQQFIFGSFSHYYMLACGVKYNRIFLDIDEPYRAKVESSGEMHDFLVAMLPTLATTSGDIV